jgi:hypothetical protein
MKYAKETLKYLKDNLVLVPCFVIAVLCAALLVDFQAYQTIAQSIQGGRISDSFVSWLRFFILFNPTNTLSIISGVIGYVVLVLDLAFIHSMIDNHIRFGSHSFRSIMSSFNINVVNGLIYSVFTAILHFLSGVIMAAIMKTSELIPLNYSYIFGMIVCALLAVFIFFVCALFSLWLPCVEITGFKKYEALAYSYALARQRVWKIFASLALPVIILVSAAVVIGMMCSAIVSYIVVPILIGLIFIYTSVHCFIVYVDAENIEREDIRKY